MMPFIAIDNRLDRRAFLGGAALYSSAAAQQGNVARKRGVQDVRALGAKGDGKTDDTAAVQAAIDKCSAAGGGHLVFPPGEYRTGTIRLKSRVTIELRNQAILRAIPDVALYPKVVEGLPPAFLFAENEEDIHITGDGKIHGSGDSHEAFIPFREQIKGPRPFGLLLRRCRNVSITGITLENSAYWMLRPDECDDVVIRGVKVRNHSNFNNDGFDICDCHRVVVSDCVLDCEDDAICLKSHTGRGMSDVVIHNCIASSHASAIKFGTASRGAFNRIAVSNCVVRPSQFRTTLHPHQMLDGITGIDLASTDGAALTNVIFNNIFIDGPLTPFFLRLGNRHSRQQSDVAPGSVQGVSFANIQAVNAGVVACSVSGYPGHYVHDVRLSNIDISLRAAGSEADLSKEVPENSHHYPLTRMFGVNLPAYGLFVRHVKDISIDRLRVSPMPGDPRHMIVTDDVRGIAMSRITGSAAKGAMRIANSTRVRIGGTETP